MLRQPNLNANCLYVSAKVHKTLFTKIYPSYPGCPLQTQKKCRAFTHSFLTHCKYFNVRTHTQVLAKVKVGIIFQGDKKLELRYCSFLLPPVMLLALDRKKGGKQRSVQ